MYRYMIWKRNEFINIFACLEASIAHRTGSDHGNPLINHNNIPSQRRFFGLEGRFQAQKRCSRTGPNK